MEKRVAFLLLFLCAVCTLRADYLWYAVSSSDDGFSDVATALSEHGITDSDDAYAQVVAVKGDAKTVLGSQGFSSAWESGQAKVSLSALGDDAMAYSYYIEIRSSYVSGAIGYSAPVSYSSLNDSITDSLTTIPTVNVWHGGGYSTGPEPTSGVLILLGSAVLALRRKRRIA